MFETKHSSATNVINGTSQNPISNTETAVINVLFPASASGGETVKTQAGYLPGNTQASLGWNYAAGSTTSLTFRVYYYRYEVDLNVTAFQATTYTQSAGVFTIVPLTLSVAAASAGPGTFDFAIPMCDGIKVTVQSVGTTTSSTLTKIHLGLRTN